MGKKVKSKPTHDFILSGLLVCDECGGPLCGQAANGRSEKYFYYGHNQKSQSECRIQRYPAIELEKIIKGQIFSFINNNLVNKDLRDIVAKLHNTKSQRGSHLLNLKIERLRVYSQRLTS